LADIATDNARPNGNSNLYIPVSTAAPSLNGTQVAGPASTRRATRVANEELMQVDDTSDRVYIHDLDAELADIESEDEKIIFLPDIEKRLSKIPQQVLTGRHSEDDGHQELVLYSVPKSLTVDEGHDSVRKAIIEARARARDKAAEEAEMARHEDMNRAYDHEHHVSDTETAHGYSSGYTEELEPDPDAMDLG
jgi:hypothetical protein